MVKADAYGHGAVRMAKEFETLGADWFAVSNLEEALQLRLSQVEKPILVLGYTPPEEAAALAKHRISQCVYSTEYAQALSRFAVEAGVAVNIHVKIDTGMSRLGFLFQDISRDEATVQEVKAACTLPGLRPEGIFTHFAVSDEGAAGDAFTMRQFGCFKEMIESLTREGVVSRCGTAPTPPGCSTSPSPTWTWSGRVSSSTGWPPRERCAKSQL